MQYKEAIIPEHLPLDRQLTLAIDQGSLYLTEYYLKMGANPRSNGNEPVFVAAQKNHTNIILFLIQRGIIDINVKLADPLKTHWEPSSILGFAAKNGNIEIIQTLLARKADVNIFDSEAIHFAARFGHAEAFNLLFSDCDYPKVKYAFKAFTRVPVVDNAPLILSALQGGSLEIIKMLLNDPRTNLLGIKNWTDHIDTGNNRLEVFKLCYQWLKDKKQEDGFEHDEKCQQFFRELMQAEINDLKTQVLTLLTLRICAVENCFNAIPYELVFLGIASQYRSIMLDTEEKVNNVLMKCL